MNSATIQLVTDIVLLFTTICGLATAVVAILRTLSKVQETHQEVGQIHQLVDGNISRIQEQLTNALSEIADLKEERAAVTHDQEGRHPPPRLPLD